MSSYLPRFWKKDIKLLEHIRSVCNNPYEFNDIMNRLFTNYEGVFIYLSLTKDNLDTDLIKELVHNIAIWGVFRLNDFPLANIHFMFTLNETNYTMRNFIVHSWKSPLEKRPFKSYSLITIVGGIDYCNINKEVNTEISLIKDELAYHMSKI